MSRQKNRSYLFKWIGHENQLENIKMEWKIRHKNSTYCGIVSSLFSIDGPFKLLWWVINFQTTFVSCNEKKEFRRSSKFSGKKEIFVRAIENDKRKSWAKLKSFTKTLLIVKTFVSDWKVFTKLNSSYCSHFIPLHDASKLIIKICAKHTGWDI